MKDVQCYELFGGIALKDHAFSFQLYITMRIKSQNWFAFSTDENFETLERSLISDAWEMFAALLIEKYVI